MLAMNSIKAVRTEWASPIVFVSKKDGQLGVCADLETECSDDAELVPDTGHGRMYQLIRQSHEILKFGGK